MMTLSSPLARRFAAVGLLIAAVGGLAFFVVLPLVKQIEDYDRTIAEREGLLAQNLEVASRRAALAAQRETLAETLSSGSRFLQGGSTELIAAGLQEQIKQLAGRHGATLNSTQALTTQDDSGFRRVTLRVGMTAGVAALQGILHSLESATPFLFVDNIELRSASLRARRRESEGADLLQIKFDLYGFSRDSGAGT